MRIAFGPGIGRPVAAAATSGFLPIIQAKLRIGAPNDRHEQEADRVADEVMRMPEQEPAMIDDLHFTILEDGDALRFGS